MNVYQLKTAVLCSSFLLSRETIFEHNKNDNDRSTAECEHDKLDNGAIPSPRDAGQVPEFQTRE